MTGRVKLFVLLLICAALLAAGPRARAQGIGKDVSSALSGLVGKGFRLPGGGVDDLPPLPPPAWKPEDPVTRSLLFSPAEIAAIKGSIGRARVRKDRPQEEEPPAPAAPALAPAQAAALVEESKKISILPIPMRRTISVAGVVFRDKDDWIVWLNGRKVTPKNLLPEIVDIRVEKEKVHLKWFDRGINGVISISLRPHQTYDIVTGVLLPG